ncbi:RNA polymerase C-22 sterol desaturase [Ascosphaera acerosa]|nr:RNA polymerase C-22 sterol desaturase [Ascosphaera acerosa]
MATMNGSFVAPPSDSERIIMQVQHHGLLRQLAETVSPGSVLLSLLLLAVFYDQARYVWLKGCIVGPAMKIPFMGPFLQSVNPKFHEYKAKWDSGELSCVSVFHNRSSAIAGGNTRGKHANFAPPPRAFRFVVIASTRDMSRKVFNSPTYVKPCVVDSAHKLLGPTNWVFLDGKAHVDYRKGLNGLFARHALSIYMPETEPVLDKYFDRFLARSKELNYEHEPWMHQFRELMCALSCRTFVGDYISEAAVKKIADDYYLITAALELVNFPIILPFTKTWHGKKAADMTMQEFSRCAAKCKVRMAAGGQVTCIMDAWVKQMIESQAYRAKLAQGIEVPQEEKPSHVLRDFTDYEIAQTIFTFLFASQDATSSASTWLFQLMADRPEILDKVREEQFRVRNGDRNVTVTMDLLEQMKYTQAVVKETLRYRPPVIMVPYEVKKDFPVTPEYTLPKGCMIVPSVWPATHDETAYEDAESFNPDRWISGNAEEQHKNWLVFGTGPHYCLGQNYAQLVLMHMVGKASMWMDWTHKPTPLSEEVKVFATIFPQDDCYLSFRPRPAPTAA